MTFLEDRILVSNRIGLNPSFAIPAMVPQTRYISSLSLYITIKQASKQTKKPTTGSKMKSYLFYLLFFICNSKSSRLCYQEAQCLHLEVLSTPTSIAQDCQRTSPSSMDCPASKSQADRTKSIHCFLSLHTELL